MSRQVSRGSAGEYQADERAGVAEAVKVLTHLEFVLQKRETNNKQTRSQMVVNLQGEKRLEE